MSMISAVSNRNTGAAGQPLAVERAKETPEAQRPESGRENEIGAFKSHERDEYVPGEPPEQTGRYWPERDEDGNRIIRTDEAAPEKPAKPEKAAGEEEKEEKYTCSTDRVDREIEKLREQREELKRKAASASDGDEKRRLEQELARVENELTQKDNDTYRRQNAVFHKVG